MEPANENVLHFIWNKGLFRANDLRTTEGKSLHIINRGILHHDSGPDFNNARIRIDQTEWAGNIELHLRSSEWKQHNHHKDSAYDGVILHVVWHDDAPVRYNDGSLIPTLVLNGLVFKQVLLQERILRESLYPIPCAPFINKVPSEHMRTACVEAVDQKMKQRFESNIENNPDWDNFFLKNLCRAFGLPVNTEAFELLAKRLDHRIIARLGNHTETEALIFGLSGFLDFPHQDPWHAQLRLIFKHLRNKYDLNTLPVHSWRFSRMRPASFPSFRLALFAGLIHARPRLFTDIRSCESLTEVHDLLNACASPYWQTHYRFGGTGNRHAASISKGLREIIIINAIVPSIMHYAHFMGMHRLAERTMNWLNALPPEENRYTRIWKDLGLLPQNAFESQGLIHLTRNQCFKKKCLECAVGYFILQNHDGNEF
jgi:hypothetical protein